MTDQASSIPLQKALFQLINTKKLRRIDVPELLRIALGRELLTAPGADRRKSRISAGLKNLFTGIFWRVFAVDPSLHWKNQKGFALLSWRKISHRELKAVTGCSSDQIRENLPILEELGLIERSQQTSLFEWGWDTDLEIRICPKRARQHLEQLRAHKASAKKPRRKKTRSRDTSRPGRRVKTRDGIESRQFSSSIRQTGITASATF